MSLPSFIDAVSANIAKKTALFVQDKLGKSFLSIALIGPLTFLPIVYQVWTAENIDSFRTITWPLMVLVNCSATLAVIHHGDWRMRLVMAVWIVVMFLVWLATLVR